MVAILAFLLAVAPAFASAETFDIQVGAGGALTYSPDRIAASPGDTVVFHFNPKNHTVTQSSFGAPCSFNGGINSGFMPVNANDTVLPTFNVTVNDTQPTWFYCAQRGHCAARMVFAINCGPDGAPNSFANFSNAANASGSSGSSYPLTTAAYGGVTIPAEPTPSLMTGVITLGSSVWTTTYRSYPNSPGPTPAVPGGNVHTVTVGGPGKLLYSPESINARVQDVVVFQFQQKNHTVTQSSFGDPCRRLNANGVTGFDSGFMPVADGATTFPTYNFTVTNTEPVWAYCRQTAHCGSGMVFAINADESGPRNFSAFKKLAITLNGTGTGTGSTPSPTSGASQINFWFATLLMPLAFFAFAL